MSALSSKPSRWKPCPESSVSPARDGRRPMSTEPLEALLKLVPRVRLLDRRPGSLKLRFGLGASALSGAGRDSLARSVPGILGTRVNPFTRTLRIEYDPECIPHDWWKSILSLRGQPENRPKVSEASGRGRGGGGRRRLSCAEGFGVGGEG